jgi:hypothetical protein
MKKSPSLISTMVKVHSRVREGATTRSTLTVAGRYEIKPFLLILIHQFTTLSLIL